LVNGTAFGGDLETGASLAFVTIKGGAAGKSKNDKSADAQGSSLVIAEVDTDGGAWVTGEIEDADALMDVVDWNGTDFDFESSEVLGVGTSISSKLMDFWLGTEKSKAIGDSAGEICDGENAPLRLCDSWCCKPWERGKVGAVPITYEATISHQPPSSSLETGGIVGSIVVLIGFD